MKLNNLSFPANNFFSRYRLMLPCLKGKSVKKCQYEYVIPLLKVSSESFQNEAQTPFIVQ